MLPGKTLLIAGALAVSIGGGVLVMGKTTQKAAVDQVVQETPTIEPSVTPTETPTDEPMPTIKIWPTNTPIPQPTSIPPTGVSEKKEPEVKASQKSEGSTNPEVCINCDAGTPDITVNKKN